MAIFDFFKRARPSLPSIDHPVFGAISATMVNEDGSLFWESPDPFTTPKGLMQVFFDADSFGPSEAQVALWSWIYDNVEQFTQAVKPMLLDRLKDFAIEDHIDDLVWTGAGLSPDGRKDGRWDLSFELQKIHSPIFTVYFENGIPTAVSADD